MSAPLLEATGIVKRFGGETALAGVDLTVHAGEVVGLLGANGAGKSTLIKTLAGIHIPDGGEIRWDGGLIAPRSLHDSAAVGIAIMFQQLNVVEDLTVGEYLSLGREVTAGAFIRRRPTRELAAAALAAIGVDLDLDRKAGSLSVAERELLEIARAVSNDARLVIMDEPSASLGEQEIARLLDLIRHLSSVGVAVVYVSHKLEEVLEITHRSVVLRDGRNAGELDGATATKDAMLRLMVGERSYALEPRTRDVAGEEALTLHGVCTDAGLADIDLTLHRGEVVGVYGLMGSGRTELVRAIYGLDPLTAGHMTLHGRPHRPTTPRQATRAGIGLVPEDRVREAMIGDGSVADNVTLSDRARGGSFWRSRRAERRVAEQSVTDIGIKVPSVGALIGALSGGNQQKVVFGRWIVAEASVLLLDDPTVGVDVAAKADIYRIIRDLTDRGVSVLVCSSELDELLALADRIAILHRGRIVETVDPSTADAASLVRASIVGDDSLPEIS